MKLLLSAYACEPGLGSEPGVGWNSVLQAARFHEVWVLTREVNRKGIEQANAAAQPARVHFVYIDLPSGLRFWKKGRRGLYLYYYLWQILAYRRAARLHREIGFDAVQHVTFVNYWMPSWWYCFPCPSSGDRWEEASRLPPRSGDIGALVLALRSGSATWFGPECAGTLS